MSVVGAAVMLGVVVAILVIGGQVNLGSALVCVVFGLVLGLTPAGDQLHGSLSDLGAWAWSRVSAL
jgi:hypothetical protein